MEMTNIAETIKQREEALQQSINGHKHLDNVNHPKHYNTGNIEVIDYIEDKNLGFNLGNAVKYISRAGVKDPLRTVEDLEKACWYVKREIERLKK